MRRPSPLPPELADRPFTVAEALRAGISIDRLRVSDLRTPHRGVRVPAHLPDTVQLRASAALLVLPRGAAFTGVTAAQLCDLPLPGPATAAGPLFVEIAPGAVRPIVEGVRFVERDLAEKHEVVLRGGVPVVHPRHVWCQLAADLGRVDAVALADAVRRRWASAEDLAEAVDLMARHRGVGAARAALVLVRYPVDSAMETRLRLLLVDAGLPEPRCGRDASDDGHGWLATPDLSWPALKVAVEYDGEHHRTDRRQWSRDIGRRQALEANGWRVIVVTADALLRRPHEVVALVAGALRARGLTW